MILDWLLLLLFRVGHWRHTIITHKQPPCQNILIYHRCVCTLKAVAITWHESVVIYSNKSRFFFSIQKFKLSLKMLTTFLVQRSTKMWNRLRLKKRRFKHLDIMDLTKLPIFITRQPLSYLIKSFNLTHSLAAYEQF